MASDVLLCKNAYDPDVTWCKRMADPQYTMDFSDVKPGAKIYWCEVCGPQAHALDKRLNEAFKTCPGFAKRLQDAIDAVEEEDDA